MDYNAENSEVKVSWKKKLKKYGLWAWIILTAFLLLCADVFTQDKETLRESVKKLNDEIKQYEFKLQENAKTYREEKKALTAAQEELQTELTAAQEALAAAQAELVTAQDNAATAGEATQAASTELETAKAALATAQAEVDNLKAELETVKAELENAKAELEAALAAQVAEENDVAPVEEAAEEPVEENPVVAVLADTENSVTLNVLDADGRSVLNVKLPADEAGLAVVTEVLGSEDAASCVLRIVTGSGATAKFSSVEATVEQVKEALGI